MTNDLVSPSDLSGFPGAPFSDEVVDAAVALLRAEVGWHIAPSRDETVTVDGEGTGQLLLPSMHVTAVSAVRNVYDPASPYEVTGYRWSKAGVVAASSCAFPYGFQALEVDLTHGYDTCPADLLPAVVAIIQASAFDVTVSQQAVGPFAVTATNLSTLGSWLDRATAGALARYRIPPRP